MMSLQLEYCLERACYVNVDVIPFYTNGNLMDVNAVCWLAVWSISFEMTS